MELDIKNSFTWSSSFQKEQVKKKNIEKPLCTTNSSQ